MHRGEAGQVRDGTAGGWTRRRLLAAGFDPALADALTDEAQIDLHELLSLVDSGCPPGLAARIVWPLDEEHSER